MKYCYDGWWRHALSRKSQRLIFVVAVAFLAVVVIGRMRYPGQAPVKLAPENCNADLWKHVYKPERLRVIEACTAVEGRVVSVKPATDGDLHIALDADQRTVLNLFNVVHGRGHFVVEIICEHTPSGEEAKAACTGYTSQVTIPKVEDRVRVTGTYVTDRDNGWNEAHPVTRIEILHQR